MQRIEKRFSISVDTHLKELLLTWGDQHNTAIWLDSNKNENAFIEGYLAIDTLSFLKTDALNAFEQLKSFVNTIKDYAFGYLSYDLKNDTEKLVSKNKDEANFPDLYFFQPKKIIQLEKQSLVFKYPLELEHEIEKDWESIKNVKPYSKAKNSLTIQNRISKEQYLLDVKEVIRQIHLGEVYELNYCQEYYANNAVISPVDTYFSLNNISSAPFASYLKFENLYLLSASPERFLRKSDDKLVSEPIKGTAKRDSNPQKDTALKRALKVNTKEIAENIMIVDLVRNDMSHIAQKGTVKVDELCEIYSFKQVHQMISSISCQLQKNIHPVDAIKACYPMGSMTGAPKIAAMKFIEELESSKRGLYSGAVGYFTPNLDFDFNVVIRSILYNQPKQYISFSVGSAITAKANPEKEYEECLIKAKAMHQVLTE